MKTINLKYKTSSGAKIPVEISIARVSRQTMVDHMTQDLDERNKWCTNGKPCAKFGCRPCCPPKVPMFDKLPKHKYVYLIQTSIHLDDYYDVYPNVKDSKSWAYFGMDGTHKMTRNINNKIVSSFKGQGFRVGGCLGCQVPKGGACKNFQPALEATGIDVVALALDVFGTEIKWREPKKPMDDMYAVGGIYTDKDISMSELKEVIKNVCNVK